MDVETLDPFDPAALCLPQDFTETANVEKLLLTVPVRKPNRQDFVRVHPDPAYRLPSVGLLELKDEGEIYLVSPDLAAGLANEFDPCTLYTAYSAEVGRRFRAKSATCSNRSRPGIPLKSAGVASSAG